MDWNDIKGCQNSKLVISHKQKIMGDPRCWHEKEGNLLPHLETFLHKSNVNIVTQSFTLPNLQDKAYEYLKIGVRSWHPSLSIKQLPVADINMII